MGAWLTVLCGWVVYGLLVDTDEMTFWGILLTSALGVAVYLFLVRKIIWGDEQDELEDGL